MKRVLLASIFTFISTGVFAASPCAPLNATTCENYPEQAQIIAQVTGVQESVVDGETVCVIKIDSSHFASHGLCPMADTGDLQYMSCGACPEIGTTVSGVLLKDVDGVTRLD